MGLLTLNRFLDVLFVLKLKSKIMGYYSSVGKCYFLIK